MLKIGLNKPPLLSSRMQVTLDENNPKLAKNQIRTGSGVCIGHCGSEIGYNWRLILSILGQLSVKFATKANF